MRMRKFGMFTMAIALLAPMAVLTAGPAGAAGGTTCKTLTGTATIKPGLGTTAKNQTIVSTSRSVAAPAVASPRASARRPTSPERELHRSRQGRHEEHDQRSRSPGTREDVDVGGLDRHRTEGRSGDDHPQGDQGPVRRSARFADHRVQDLQGRLAPTSRRSRR